MKRILHFLSVFALGIALGWVASVWRYGLPMGPALHPPGPPDFAQIFAELELTPAQRTKLDAIVGDGVRAIRSEAHALNSEREVFDQAMRRAAPRAEIEGKFQALLSAKDRFELTQFAMVAAIRDELSPEQLTTFMKLLPPPPPPGMPPPEGQPR